MKKPLLLIAAATVLASPALAQVRPENCQPVLPVVDRVASVLPQDVITQPVGPTALAKKRFLGLPFLLPALLAGGGVAALASGHSNSTTSETVSPA